MPGRLGPHCDSVPCIWVRRKISLVVAEKVFDERDLHEEGQATGGLGVAFGDEAAQQDGASIGHDDGVFQGWLFGIIRYDVDFLELLAHTRLHCRREVFVLNLVERRRVIWKSAFHQKWIVTGSW